MASSLRLLFCVLLGAAPSVRGGAHLSDIVTTAVGTGSHGILAAALTKANLVETLKGDGPFTVFAPTDAAFAAALSELGITQEQLLARADLADILKYHVASGKVMSTALKNDQSVPTLQGASVKVAISEGAVSISGAKVSTADVECSNGVIHVIDKVLLPPAKTAVDGSNTTAVDGAWSARGAVSGLVLSLALLQLA